jgi:hypothetical protein
VAGDRWLCRDCVTSIRILAPGGSVGRHRGIQDEYPEARESLRVLIGRARENKQFLFLFVNYRLEGNAPLTILSLVDK